ncbi:MAG: pyridoxamine 5'-phosphate oxidase family protein [Candidatus Omnitrophica bacterium]|nr:pyridoxamine 5'-phosphate oxidase family protein [Candidatus Omnitrophota bacterium]
MKHLTEEIIYFFRSQNFIVVSSVDKGGSPHASCKGLIDINKNGRIYLLDLYRKKTFENLKRNHNISITAVDEHHFRGFCLKGKARLVEAEKLKSHILKAWEEKIVDRITNRVLKNIHGEKGHAKHPESRLPRPAYMIVMETEEIVDLTPAHIK